MSIFNQLQNTISPTTIDDFKSVIGRRSGLAPANRFVVFMSPPSQTLLNLDLQNVAANLLSGNFGPSQFVNDPRDIGILCESCSLPGRQIQTLDKQHLGFRQSVKVPQGYFNEDVNFVFHLEPFIFPVEAEGRPLDGLGASPETRGSRPPLSLSALEWKTLQVLAFIPNVPNTKLPIGLQLAHVGPLGQTALKPS